MMPGPAADSRTGGRSDGPVCPACGKAVDPLRAGHVAIIGDEFRYYCDAECKREHVHSLRSGVLADVETAEPPAVAPFEPVSVARARAAPSEETRPSSRLPLSAPTTNGPVLEAPAIEEQAPITMRSIAPTSGLRPVPAPGVASAPRVDASRRRARRIELLSLAGIVAGVLASSVALAGAEGDALRVPFAALAAAALVTRSLAAPREPAEPHPLFSVVPPLVALAIAFWDLSVGDAHALSLASFAGLAAASVLVLDVSLSRARASVDAARSRIARSLELEVRVVRGEQTTQVPASEVRPGEEVVFAAGEVVGVDAIVTAGDAVVTPWLDSLTEVAKKEGDAIVAGAKIVSGRLRATTTWAGQDRAWVRLALGPLLRVDIASPIARVLRIVVERGIPIAAVLVAIAAFAANAPMGQILAAACAAAIAFGARGAMGVASLHLARGQLAALSHGIVYKDAAAFDEAGRTDVVVLCSRGTVLMGEPEIVALEALGPVDVGRVLSLAAGAETASTHPFASAILRTARARGARPDNVRSAVVHAGLGVTALASTGERLVVGSRALLLEERVSVAIADARVTELEAQGRSVLLIALAGKLVGLLGLQDGLRPGARAAVQRLLDARLEPVLLSGEARETCDTIGRALDIDHVRPEVLPADRGAEVRALGEGGRVVAVLGHIATDDGALGAADVSIAMGAAGATPGEWSASLASDDLRDAARALSIAHEARDNAKVAIALGAAPGLAAVVALVFGVAPLAVAPVAAVAGAVAALVHARR
jgi:Cu+-exporting ATPase